MMSSASSSSPLTLSSAGALSPFLSPSVVAATQDNKNETNKQREEIIHYCKEYLMLFDLTFVKH